MHCHGNTELGRSHSACHPTSGRRNEGEGGGGREEKEGREKGRGKEKRRNKGGRRVSEGACY